MINSLFHSNKASTLHTRCVCEICDCGKHHCPVHTDIPLQEQKSTFQHSYKAWPIERPKPYNYERPGGEYRYGDGILQTSYQTQFRKYPLPEKEAKEAQLTYRTPPIETNTDYRTNYKNYQIPKKLQQLKPVYKPSQRAEQWSSTYNTDFLYRKNHLEGPMTLDVKDGPNINKPMETTVYRSAYLKPNLSQSKRIPVPKQHNLYGDPGNTGSTTYKTDFKDIPLKQQTCPVDNLPRRPNILQNGKSHLNYNAYENRWV